MTANTMEEAEEPAFAGPAKEKVAAGAASFSDLVVEWDKILAPEGEQVMVDANLLVGGKREYQAARDVWMWMLNTDTPALEVNSNIVVIHTFGRLRPATLKEKWSFECVLVHYLLLRAIGNFGQPLCKSCVPRGLFPRVCHHISRIFLFHSALPVPVPLTIWPSCSTPPPSEIAASTSFPMVIKPSKAPFRAIVCIGNNPVPEPGQGVPSHPVGSTISGLRLRLVNQSGAPVPTDAVTFQVRFWFAAAITLVAGGADVPRVVKCGRLGSLSCAHQQAATLMLIFHETRRLPKAGRQTGRCARVGIRPSSPNSPPRRCLLPLVVPCAYIPHFWTGDCACSRTR